MSSILSSSISNIKKLLAMSFAICNNYFLFIFCLMLWVTLLFSSLWPVSVFYAAFIILFDNNVSSTGGRRSEFIRNSTILKPWVDYFPIKLIKTAELDVKKNYIFGCHPHGVMPSGLAICFNYNNFGFKELFSGFTPHPLAAKIFFQMPFYREWYLFHGICDVSKESIRHLCNKPEGGNIACICVGGGAESLDARPGLNKLTLKQRKGFIKMALETGAQLVPVYSFGENDLYTQPYNPRGSKLRNFQEEFRKITGFALIVFWGRFGLIPFKRPITIVVGEAIQVTKKVDFTQEDVDQLHETYIEKLKELFDKYKKVYYNPDAELEII